VKVLAVCIHLTVKLTQVPSTSTGPALTLAHALTILGHVALPPSAAAEPVPAEAAARVTAAGTVCVDAALAATEEGVARYDTAAMVANTGGILYPLALGIGFTVSGELAVAKGWLTVWAVQGARSLTVWAARACAATAVAKFTAMAGGN